MPTIYSLDHGVGFIHIPKCAGSTVSTNLIWGPQSPTAFEGNMAADWDPQGQADAPQAEARPAPAIHGWQVMEDVAGIADIMARNNTGRAYVLGAAPHSRACDLRDALGAEAYDGLDTFSVVRDPLLRLESTYHFIRDRPANGRHALVCRMDFEDYVWWHCAEAYQPQHEWLTDEDGTVIVKQVLRPDGLDAHVSALLLRLYGTGRPLVRSNRSTNATLPPYASCARLSPGAYALLVRTYARDFEVLGYPIPPYEEVTGRKGPTPAEEAALAAAIPQVIADPVAAAATLGLDVATLEWRLRNLGTETLVTYLSQALANERTTAGSLRRSLARHAARIRHLEAKLGPQTPPKAP